jgi:hypothetical protein
MRHLRSILYALVLAPAVWVLAGVGFTHDLTSRGRDFFTAESLSGLLLLIFSGILFAILAFSPISPLGPTLAGATFLGVTYWAWSNPESYAGAWSPEVVKDGFDLSRPGYGLAALLAVPLLCTALSARRWARYEPPVLPIIGEIGRFRGSAKVAPGANVAAVETTVFRTAQQADRTQVLPTPAAAASPASAISRTAAADRTVALAPAADATVAFPAAIPATPATPATPVAPAGPKVTAAGDDTTTVFAVTKPAAEPTPKPVPEPVPEPGIVKPAAQPAATTPAGAQPAATTPAGAQPAGSAPAGGTVPATREAPKTNKPGIIANSAIAAEAGKAAAADDKTTVIPAQPAAAEDKNDEATTVLPASDPAISKKDPADKSEESTGPEGGDRTEPLKLPAS